MVSNRTNSEKVRCACNILLRVVILALESWTPTAFRISSLLRSTVFIPSTRWMRSQLKNLKFKFSYASFCHTGLKVARTYTRWVQYMYTKTFETSAIARVFTNPLRSTNGMFQECLFSYVLVWYSDTCFAQVSSSRWGQTKQRDLHLMNAMPQSRTKLRRYIYVFSVMICLQIQVLTALGLLSFIIMEGGWWWPKRCREHRCFTGVLNCTRHFFRASGWLSK